MGPEAGWVGGVDGDRVSVWEDEKVLEVDVAMVVTAM